MAKLVFPFRERCLWFCILTLFSIFWIYFMLYLFLICTSLLKWMPRILTKSVIFHLIGNLLLLWKTLFVWISNSSVLFIFSKHPVAFLYLENCWKMKGMSEKLVNKKLVSSAYCKSFRVSFLPGSLNPLMFVV